MAAALDFVLDLVSNTEIEAGEIIVLCPYAANVKHLEHLRKRPKFAPLAGMPPASTVDSYQGQEMNIVVCVLGMLLCAVFAPFWLFHFLETCILLSNCSPCSRHSILRNK